MDAGVRKLVETVRHGADVDERRDPDALDPDRVGERDAARNHPQPVLGRRVPGRVAGEAVRDVPAQRVVAAEVRSRVVRQLSGASLDEGVEGDRVGRRIFLGRIAAFVEQGRHAKRDVPEHGGHHSRLVPRLPHGGVEEHARLKPRIGLMLAVTRVVAQPRGDDEGVVVVRLVEQLRKDLVGRRMMGDLSRREIVTLTAQAERGDPVPGQLGKREVGPRAEIEHLVAVARLVALARVRAEAEEPARQALLVAAECIEVVALLDDHAAPGQLLMLEPATPDEPVLLLPLRRVRGERAEKLAAPLVAKIDVGQRDAAAGADVALEEELRRHEARHQEPLEHVARLDAPFGDVAPAFGMGEVFGQRDFRNPSARLHALERVVLRQLLRERR